MQFRWQNIEHKSILNIITKFDGPPVQLPKNEIIRATEKGELPLDPALSSTARTAMVLSNLKSSNLISLGQLCDDGCSIILNKHIMQAYKNNKVVMKGIRNKTDGLWDIPIQKTNITTNVCMAPNIQSELYCKCSFDHKVHRSPTPSPSKKHHNIPSHLQHIGDLATTNDVENTIVA